MVSSSTEEEISAMTSPLVTTFATHSRRELLAAWTGLATYRCAAVRAAEPGHVIVSTQGGDYAELLNEIIDAPLVRPAGIDVIQDIGDKPARAAKL
jgi:putative spermidine/putrescine transport system substrate-binding protein